MGDFYIKKIHVKKVRNIENLDITLSETERKHLILTGKNGSGKTSLLEAMRGILDKGILYGKHNGDFKLSQAPDILEMGVTLEPDLKVNDLAKMSVTYISARGFRVPDITPPKSLESIDISIKPPIDKPMVKEIYKYMNNLKLQAAYPRSASEKENIERWFSNFESILKEVYQCDELQILYNASSHDFTISIPNLEPFALNQMSDGYAAYINIFMELLLRLDDGNSNVNFASSGIILIDEIETHLHVELQKRALPFLTKMFPNVQFIVATHSPFVITSIENAVVFDLEKRIRLPRGEDDLTPLTDYSYTDIVEGYFDEPEYSESLQEDFDRYIALVGQESRTPEEREETRNLFERLSNIPGTSPLSTAFYLFNRRLADAETE